LDLRQIKKSTTPHREYESVDCPACAKIHFINRKTGKLMGGEDR